MRSASRQSLVLLETVSMLGVFIIALAVAVGLFGAASVTSRRSENIGRGALCCQTAAECFRAAGGDPAATADLLGGELLDGAAVLIYNDDWEADPEGDKLLTVAFRDGDGLVYADISLTEGGETLFSLGAAAVTAP